MKNIKETLTTGEGYVNLQNFIPSHLITNFRKKIYDLIPVRASSSKKQYAEKTEIKKLPDISVWWSQAVDDFDETKAIRRIVDPLIFHNFGNFSHYISDVVTINSKSTWVNPHVDTPHRFENWNYDPRLLGIQCIISLEDTNKDNGSTGIVPFSQKRNYDIKQCYSGYYDNWFIENCQQPDMPKGSLLFYNCRILHSSMPNPSSHDRPALLINYLENSIIKEVKSIDNVWNSNESTQ